MSKYTPGPWIARRVDSQEWHIDAPNGDPTLGHVKWSGLAVYGCDDFRQGGAIAAEANARLIASAPDLLEALELCLHAVKLAGWEGDYSAQKARAAIAKATGAQA